MANPMLIKEVTEDRLSLLLKRNMEINPKFSNVETEDIFQKICTSKEDLNMTDDIPAEEISKWIEPRTALEKCRPLLSNYERHEILNFPKIFFIGSSKMKNSKISGDFPFGNFGFDDMENYYMAIPHDHIGYRYEILKVLGKGSFGQVLKVYDHKTGEFAALKIIRNDKRFLYQAKREVKILEHLLREDASNTANVVHIKNNFIFRSHMCIVFELMSLNLYELVKKNKFRGMKVAVVRKFAYSIAIALSLVHRKQIIHGDLKPENVLLKKYGMTGIKLVDFGSSCYTDGKLMTYVQSRFYRAPEVILECGYDTAVDIWSFGCLVAELVLGQPLLPGQDEDDQLALMIEMLGPPPASLLARSRDRGSRFISCTTGQPRYLMRRGIASRGAPGSRDIEQVLGPFIKQEQDSLVIDFIRRCLHWDPATRLTADQALGHPWLASLF